MSLLVYNTLTGKREPFEPLDPPRVSMYVCGPTVYGHSHLGHAKSYVSFDVIVRWLRALDYQVNYVQNITDVGHLTDDADSGEDKVIAEARRRGLHPMAVVETFLKSYLDDMDALNVLRPDIMPRATGHIPEQIAQIAALVEKGHAYEAGGSVYFSVASFPAYGRLSHRNVAEMEAGARVAVTGEKRHPADFALWKTADPSHLMQWPSPWGPGYPGWHIECSAMSQKYLGQTIDIHGGGMENKFPHHECEIAQAEAATGQPFVRYWMHNNMCTLNGQKMGKSLGNAISLKQVLYEGTEHLEKTYEPAVVRHFILTSHYRQPLDFSSAALQAAESGTHKLRDAAWALRDAAAAASGDETCDELAGQLAGFEARFRDAMNEDFNTAAAIAVLFDLAKAGRGWLEGGLPGGSAKAASALMQHLTGDVLGLRWEETAAEGGGRDDDLIGLLVELRQTARANKDFAMSDQIRDRLAAMGIELRDGPEGTTW